MHVIEYVSQCLRLTRVILAVYGCCGRQAKGEFFLRLESEETGNICNDSTVVDLLSSDTWSYEGSTETGKFYNLTRCGFRGESPRLSTFTLRGYGDYMFIDAKETSSDESSRLELGLYNGSCVSPVCQTFNYGYDAIRWLSKEDASYFVAIQGC